MIAYTGKIMLESGPPLPLQQSQVNPSFRSSDAIVTWRPDDELKPPAQVSDRARGAEAVVSLGRDAEKRRCSKRYRVQALDRKLIMERTRAEARLISMARRSGVPTPVIRNITADTIVMERVQGPLLTHALTPEHVGEAGRTVGRLHQAGIVHGDLTTSNIIVRGETCVLIDFGLAQVSSEIEARGVDIHVFFQTLESTTGNCEKLKTFFAKGYKEAFSGAEDVLFREQEIEKRGRYL
jgi:N6-L-threonylcarbamoyladenine synthase/protein kinase Bud32